MTTMCAICVQNQKIHSTIYTKEGRTCGSGKKYKQCCGK